ncbi:MAG: ATP synthase F1 subunit epsilon [Anaerolineae bacterium]|nr:ATP synthase F1 subunit epsilon [Anaerolineae bacterium]
MSSQEGYPQRVNLDILSPEQILFSGQVSWIEVPLQDGLLGIWPGHAPLIAALASGQVRFEVEGEIQTLQIEGGILRIGIERCAILVGALRTSTELPEGDVERLAAEFEEALGEALSQEEIDALQQPSR